MIGDTKEEIEARIGTLRHVKAFIDVLIKARKAELIVLRKQKKTKNS